MASASLRAGLEAPVVSAPANPRSRWSAGKTKLSPRGRDRPGGSNTESMSSAGERQDDLVAGEVGVRERPESTYSQKLEKQIQDAAYARDRSKERMVLEELRTQLSSARVAVARAGNSSESILEARERLAAQEHALISIQSRVEAQDAALEATRSSLHAKEDQLHELQHSTREREASVNKQQEKLEAQCFAFKKERSHLQDRIRYLERELDAERLRRQGLEHKGHQLLEDLVKEQRERDKDKMVANRRLQKLTRDFNAATAEKEALECSLAGACCKTWSIGITLISVRQHL